MVRVHALEWLGPLCGAMEAVHWSSAVDHEAVVLRGLAMCFHPQPEEVREASRRFARAALALRTASTLHSAVVDWVLHALAAKQQNSNSATLQHQADVMELLPAVVPSLSVNPALRLFERLLSLFTVGRLAPLILAALCAFFHSTEMEVPVRLSVAVQSLLSRVQPSAAAIQLHCALLKHLPEVRVGVWRSLRSSRMVMIRILSEIHCSPSCMWRPLPRHPRLLAPHLSSMCFVHTICLMPLLTGEW
jgi:hypothetical protein